MTSDEAGSHRTTPGQLAFGVNVDGVVLVAGDVPEPASIQDLIPLCTGALIADRHILSAAHCFDEDEDGAIDAIFHWPHIVMAFEIDDQIIRMEFGHDDILVPDHWYGDPSADIAVVQLREDAPAEAPRYDLYGGTDEVGKPFVLVGYGGTGHGSTGESENATDTVKRAGMNRFEAVYYETALAYDFDSGLEENNSLALSGFESDLGFGVDEVFMGSGDSGGPAFIEGAIAGLTSWPARLPEADATDLIDSSWGEAGFNIRVSQFVAFLREATDAAAIFVGIPGDFNKNGILDASDVDLLAAEIRSPSGDMDHDLNGDGELTADDHVSWVHELALTWFGDANLDGAFSSSDLIRVFAAGEYEDGIDENSTWATGDWTGDAEFDTSDLVLAFQDGGYEKGPPEAVSAVPEPTGALVLVIGVAIVSSARRRDSSTTRRR